MFTYFRSQTKNVNKHLCNRFLSKQVKHLIFIKLFMKFLNFDKKWRNKLISGKIKKSVLKIRIRIRWIRKILASWIRIWKKADLRIGSKGQNINRKLQNKVLTFKTQIWTIKKQRDYKNFMISELFIKF